MRELARDDISEATSVAVRDRIRHAVQAVLEQVLEEERREHRDGIHQAFLSL
jgi:hypothetical protein